MSPATDVVVDPPTHPADSDVPTADAALTDGDYFGYLTALDPAARTVSVDIAQWLSGPAADRAAQEDGLIEPGEHVPNDFYVRNQLKAVRVVPLADSVLVTVARCPQVCAQYAGTLAGLAASLDTVTQDDASLAAAYRGRYSQYWLAVRGGRVERIDEQYVP